MKFENETNPVMSLNKKLNKKLELSARTSLLIDSMQIYSNLYNYINIFYKVKFKDCKC